MSSIRKVAITEPLVDVVDHKQVCTNSCVLKVGICSVMVMVNVLCGYFVVTQLHVLCCRRLIYQQLK